MCQLSCNNKLQILCSSIIIVKNICRNTYFVAKSHPKMYKICHIIISKILIIDKLWDKYGVYAHIMYMTNFDEPFHGASGDSNLFSGHKNQRCLFSIFKSFVAGNWMWTLIWVELGDFFGHLVSRNDDCPQ